MINSDVYIFTATCSICKAKYEANNAQAITEWLEAHEEPGAAMYRLHQIASWLQDLDQIPEVYTPGVRLEDVERILRGALSGEDAPVLMA